MPYMSNTGLNLSDIGFLLLLVILIYPIYITASQLGSVIFTPSINIVSIGLIAFSLILSVGIYFMYESIWGFPRTIPKLLFGTVLVVLSLCAPPFIVKSGVASSSLAMKAAQYGMLVPFSILYCAFVILFARDCIKAKKLLTPNDESCSAGIVFAFVLISFLLGIILGFIIGNIWIFIQSTLL